MNKRKPTVLLDMNDNPELFAQLDTYRKLKGWTWKRFMLVGIGESVARDGENPELALAIVEQLTNRR